MKKQLKQYSSVDSNSSGGERTTTTMTKQGETLPLQAYDEFSESRHESSTSAQSQPTTNCHSSYPSDTHDDEDREQQLFAPIPFVRSSTSCSSRNRLSQLSVNTFASGVATEDMDRDEDIIDSPSYHYASLSTPRNSPTNGNSPGLKRSRSSMPWLALAAGAGVAVLGAAAFWSDSVGNAGPLLTTPNGTKQMNKNDPLKINDDEEDEAHEEYTDEQFQSKQVPPLSELVVGDEIRGNVDWMIDFAIIGNPKCGTTFLMVRSLLMEFGAKIFYFSFIISYNSIGLPPSSLLYPSLALARSQS